jgi:hypothetical protein
LKPASLFSQSAIYLKRLQYASKAALAVSTSKRAAASFSSSFRYSSHETLYGKFPRLQILTVAQLLEGKQPHIPWVDPASFKKAAREGGDEQQHMLF